MTSRTDVCQNRPSVNRNVEETREMSAEAVQSHVNDTPHYHLTIPDVLFVYVVRDLFLIYWSEEGLQCDSEH